MPMTGLTSLMLVRKENDQTNVDVTSNNGQPVAYSIRNCRHEHRTTEDGPEVGTEQFSLADETNHQ